MFQPHSAGWQSMLQPLRLSPALAAGRCSRGWRFVRAVPAWDCDVSQWAARPGMAAAGWAPSRLVCTCAAAAELADAPVAVASPSPRRAEPAACSQPACDYTLLAACVRELQERWVPAKVDQAVLGSATTLYLRLRAEAAAPARTRAAAAPAALPAPAARTQPAGKSGKLKKRAYTASLQGALPALAREPDAAPAKSAPGPAARQAPEVASGWLALSWHTWAARLCIASPPGRGNTAEAFSLGAQVQQHLRGLVLLSADLPRPWERVCRLAFGPRLGGAASHHIYLEVQGRNSNLVLTRAADDLILGSGLQVGSRMSSMRQVQVGRRYELPPKPLTQQPPSLEQSDEAWRGAVSAVEADVASGRCPSWGREPTVVNCLMAAFQGVSPGLAAELCERAGVAAQLRPGDLTDAAWQALAEQWRHWLRAHATGSFGATLDAASGRLCVLGQPAGAAPRASVHALVDAVYGRMQEEDALMRQHKALGSVVEAALKRMRIKLQNMQRQAAVGECADATKKQADLIMSALHSIRPGAASVQVEDWDTGEVITVPLDPNKEANDAAEALYKAARKQRRTEGAIAPVMEATLRQIEYLEQVQAQLQMLEPKEAGADDVLRGMQDELVQGGHMRAPPQAALAKVAAVKARKAVIRAGGAPGKRAFREFISPAGLKVLVGRNPRENDELTRSAADADLWFHARGCPGSHTILHVPASGEPNPEDVTFAASLAAYFSKARNEGKPPVIVARAKDVTKPKGAPPGMVKVSRERVVQARPSSVAALAEKAQAA